MIYLKIFTLQDLRPPGSGGSNTLISSKILATGFFPVPQRPPGYNLKFYHASGSTDLEFGYSGNMGDEVRIKSFSTVMMAEGAVVGDLGIFKQHPAEANAFDVTFVKQADPQFTFLKSLMSGNHHAEEVIAEPADDGGAAIPNPHNWLIYGAPGTGKSNFLETQAVMFGDRKLRVTFYPDYSYAKFVGSYKPATYYKNSSTGVTYHEDRISTAPAAHIVNEPVIDYRFVPGPFLTLLISALKGLDEGKNYLLLVEELNRAPAAAVFGEIFQLLDRKKGKSEYRVRLSNEAMSWMQEELNDAAFDDIRNDIMDNGIYIPRNLYLWATMNSADQGVFPLDAAFKRRWQVRYLPLDANEDKLSGLTLTFAGTEYTWNYLRKAINSWLTIRAGVAEDRLIAPFFISPEELGDKDNAPEVFKSKLLLYLKDDVLRHKKGFFNVDNQTISAISSHFKSDAIPAKAWDFFSILNQEDDGAAAHIRKTYEDFAVADRPVIVGESSETAGTVS
ncbi:MAG: hypothetical protein EOO20_03590 [Chryseobacterium sp.]|nr:MAG: hypothetical protein EOO20_03590 [Chryseobacterium sp.]